MGSVIKGVGLEERDLRFGRVALEMAAAELDGLLVYSPAWRRENFRYLSGAPLRSSAGMVFLPAAGAATAFVISLEDEAAVRNAGFIEDVRQLRLLDIGPLGARIRESGRRLTLGVAGLEFMPHRVRRHLVEALPEAKLVPASSLLDRLRRVKSDWEIAQLRQAGRICDAAWKAFVAACQPGAREFEIVARVEATLRMLGGEDNFMLIASGGTEVRGMTPPSDRRLAIGDMVRTELTPQWNGYWTQICRTAVLGKPNDRQRRSFELFDEAVAAGLAVLRPGVTAHEVAKAENDVFRKHGYGDYCSAEYTRVRGHCLGLHFDEVPILEGVETVLERNAVVIVHPNTFTPLAGYHVLGDPVVVTEHGAEKLIATPREFDQVPIDG
ncbi:MAG TPA: Xaa-Pro peptidase family protein [Hyphomicrobiales bacterium]|nr:Xaa-Pro peptidase family protein [Hyphomicrobiales bacterium]